jgi:hypothetical protein
MSRDRMGDPLLDIPSKQNDLDKMHYDAHL